MKSVLSKVLVCILIVLMLNNFFLSNLSYAEEESNLEIAGEWILAGISEIIEDLLGTVVGIIALIPKLLGVALSFVTQMLMSLVGYSQGSMGADGNPTSALVGVLTDPFLTPFNIIFNDLAIVDVDIFNIPSTPGAIKDMREAIASWYYVMRNIASVILLCVLIYVGIRMAISTIASDKAMYKKMLVDWCVSLALIFVMQYIIIFTISVNSALVNSLSEVKDSTGVSTAVAKLYATSLLNIDMSSVAAATVLVMLTWQTISLLISYIQRMLKVSFLIIISPLITLTYSIDKMGDGKAQALNTWLKEFVYSVLIQSFHCVIYVCFIGIALELLGRPSLILPEFDDNNLGATILVIMCVQFTKEAEKILGKIFNFNDSVSGASLAMGMVATGAMLKNASKIGKGASTAINAGKNVSAKLATAGNAIMQTGAAQHLMEKFGKNQNDNSSGGDSGGSSAAPQTDSGTSNGEKAKKGKAKKGTKEKMKKQAAKSPEQKAQEELERETEKQYKKLREQNPGSNEGDLRRVAGLAAQKKIDKKKEKIAKRNQRASDLKELGDFLKNDESMKELRKEVLPSLAAAGVGFFLGAGSLGMGTDGIQSIMQGTAGYKATQEVMKNSTKTMTKEAAKYLRGSGTDPKDFEDKLDSIAERGDEFKKASEAIDKIFDKIAAELGDMNPNDQAAVKSVIRNSIEQNLTKEPESTNGMLKDEALNALAQNPITKDFDMSKLSNAINSAGFDEMADFQRDNRIYNTMANANSVGLSQQAIIRETRGQYKKMYKDDDTSGTATKEEVDKASEEAKSAREKSAQAKAEAEKAREEAETAFEEAENERNEAEKAKKAAEEAIQRANAENGSQSSNSGSSDLQREAQEAIDKANAANEKANRLYKEYDIARRKAEKLHQASEDATRKADRTRRDYESAQQAAFENSTKKTDESGTNN